MERGVHAAAWLVLAVAAFLLWPERWGGSMTYVITSGSSMAPTWEAGDLAVLRSADEYRVGDVAAYDSSELGRIVMHRITQETGAGYTFQGDNNDFPDPETVTDEQMLGELVLRVPDVGTYLTWLLEPVNLMVAAAALFLLFGDRRKEQPPAEPARPALGPLRLTSFSLPPAAVAVEVADEADLVRLAEHYDRPVLEVDGRRYVLQGDLVYAWSGAELKPEERRRTPRKRSSAYDRRPVPGVPGPRGEDELVVSGR